MVVRELAEEFQDAEGMLVVSFAGLGVAETETLRSDLAAKGIRFRMVRNRLALRVLSERGVEFDAKVLSGNTAIAYGDAEAAIGAAKILTTKELRKAGKVKVRAALLQGSVLDAGSAAALADVPDRETLRAQILGAISGPARALVCVLQAVPSATARVLQAHCDELAQADG
jgi:large subunit ribosomal protein L10